MPGLPVLRDLIVDMSQFYRQYRAVSPFLINNDPEPEVERLQSPREREQLDGLYECILCACCMGACPVVNENEQFLGPASLVWAFRFIFDSRDDQKLERLRQVDSQEGVWACVNHFECTRVCPRGIKITKLINQTKRHIKAHRDAPGAFTPGASTPGDSTPGDSTPGASTPEASR